MSRNCGYDKSIDNECPAAGRLFFFLQMGACEFVRMCMQK